MVLFPKRELIMPKYVYEALPGRFYPWLVYASEISFYFVDDDMRKDDRDLCFYDHGSPLGTADVYIYADEARPFDYFAMPQLCVHHEVGHYIDDARGRISDTDEFRRAAQLSIELWENLPEGAYHWRYIGDRLAHFPGINGNPPVPCEDCSSEWGGWRELYAELHEVDYLIQIPPPLQKYFRDFIPWIWW